ncbi:MAG: NigD-like protein [Rikenellaceae bacterium]|nr:NigD-like protein [Rikenellaceae bacterium]
MGKIFRNCVLVGILSLIMGACSTDSEFSLDTRYLNFGRVEAVDGDISRGFQVRLDDGTWLIVNNSQSYRGVDDGDRIQLIYTLLGDAGESEGYKRFFALLNYGQKLLSKEPVLQSYIDYDYEHRQDSIGNDPIRVNEAWFGGRYLNIEFSVPRKSNTNRVHFINLVADDVNSDNVLNVYLRHNGYEDVPEPGDTNFRYSPSFVSFDLMGLLKEGQGSLSIKLHWTDFAGNGWEETVEYTDSGDFVPYGKSSSTSDMKYTADDII